VMRCDCGSSAGDMFRMDSGGEWFDRWKAGGSN
jgi:hypothetical protein